MRRSAADYLEAERIEELVQDLRREGYRVETEARLGDEQFDVLARRDGELLVFEVKARSRLGRSADEVARRRAAARAAGVTGFRIEVVNPPHETEVAIEGLEAELSRYIAEVHPSELDEMFAAPRVERVSHLGVESITVRHDGIRVRGWAHVRLEVNYGGIDGDTIPRVSDSLPFTFDVDLGMDLKLARVLDLKVDLGDYANVPE